MATVISWLFRIAFLIGLVLVGQQIIAMIIPWLNLSLMPHTEDMLHRTILFGTVVYILLMAIPFVPGAEIGLTLLTALGGAIAPLIYLATAISLMLAYLVGRVLPPTVLQKCFTAFNLSRAARFTEEMSSMTDEELREKLGLASGHRYQRFLLRYRYVALALAINMPGNVVLGGGGGIAMIAGLSRLFDPLPFLLTILIAVLPVPLMFFLGSL